MMKKAKKLVALLLAGVLALGVLTGCSGGSAGPLTEENVVDYIIDYYQAAAGFQLKEDKNLETIANNVRAYVNEKITTEGEYQGKSPQQVFGMIVEGEENKETKKNWFGNIQPEAGYEYYVNYASTDESYRTELFSQGKTVVVATILSGMGTLLWEQPTETSKTDGVVTDGAVCVIKSKINGQNGMISIIKLPAQSHGSGGSGSGSVVQPTEPDPSTGVTTGA